jgi:hypothetical protein
LGHVVSPERIIVDPSKVKEAMHYRKNRTFRRPQ